MLKKKFRKKQYAITGSVFAFFVLVLVLLHLAGSFLVVSHQPRKADAIVVLMGNVPERIPTKQPHRLTPIAFSPNFGNRQSW